MFPKRKDIVFAVRLKTSLEGQNERDVNANGKTAMSFQIWSCERLACLLPEIGRRRCHFEKPGRRWFVADVKERAPQNMSAFHCRVVTQFPPRQLAVSPIQSSASVGALLTLDENKINKRRDRQKARLRRRAKEWQKTAGSTGPEVRHRLLGTAGSSPL